MRTALMAYCTMSHENFPYKAGTFNMISKIASLIKIYAGRYNVPPIALAGAIADEYNTQRGIKGYLDWFQDKLLSYLPDFAIELDSRLGFNNKFLNSTKHDIGKGNIKVETAKKMYDRYKILINKDLDSWKKLVEYILTDEGTVHFAALVIKRAKFLFEPFTKSYADEIKEAVYVTYYKQGESYYCRFRSKPAIEIAKGIKPGEGCRVYFQRDQFKKALGIS